MPSKLSEQFGLEIAQLRDNLLREWHSTLDGRMRGKEGERARRQLSSFSAEQVATLRNEILPDIVDTAVHNFLAYLEGMADLRMRDEKGEVSENLLTNPDGLVFPLFGDDGWLARFSKYPSSFVSGT